MAGKACVLTSRRLHYAMDKLTKNALIDIVTDRARAELGENADDDDVAELIQRWMSPVYIVRGDRMPSLSLSMASHAASEARYREQHGLNA